VVNRLNIIPHKEKDWLGKHIMETDKKYGPYLAGKGVK
jgi:hypothetical protein